MGGEIGQGHEWREREEMPWQLLQWPSHRGIQCLVRDLNRLYSEVPALHDLDFSAEGFSWIDCHDADQSVISWLRYTRDGSFVVVMLNLTPVPRENYRIGVPAAGEYQELLNSDSRYYGGSDLGNAGTIRAHTESWMGRPACLTLTLPPLAGIVLAPIRR
jgi:1,4-alpha-glucan branching enzyme